MNYAEVDQQLDQQEDMQDDAMYDENRMPQSKETESLYNLFHKVLDQEDNSKVANLDNTEIGMLNLSVRDCQRIALLARTLDHPKFADYFEGVAEIILQTSASKKGWFTELFVSNKKQLTRSLGANTSGENKDKKWSFGKK
jgi:hypothetical protein